MSLLNPRELGRAVRETLTDVGYGARFFWRLLALLPATMRRFSLVRDQIHFLGN